MLGAMSAPAGETAPPSPASRESASRAKDAPLTVSQLASRVAGAIEAGFPQRVRVIGQVTNFRERTHWYFDLKDAEAVVNCVVFSSAARRARFTPEAGHEVVLSGRVEFYAKQGKITLIADSLAPVGAGALDLAFRKLVEEVRALGWFAEERKRAIPAFPRRIAIVTSRSGAALHDVLDTLRRRSPWIEVLIADAPMQGEGASEAIARVLAKLGRHRATLSIDAILLTRGGGSMEDLWAFNERVVAEAIVASPVPVIAAIGHETDTTIAELVADLRAATPTQAAMRLSPDREALLEQLDASATRLLIATRRAIDRSHSLSQARRQLAISSRTRLASERHRLVQLAARLERQRPIAVLERRKSRLLQNAIRLRAAVNEACERAHADDLDARLRDAMPRRLRGGRARLDALARQLDAVGPRSVLARGYSCTMRADGSIVRSAGDVRPGDSLRTRVAHGEIGSVVSATDGSSAVMPAIKKAPRPPRASRTPDSPATLDLFNPNQ
jgi:exodeoxyribonuclease VII large subunit